MKKYYILFFLCFKVAFSQIPSDFTTSVSAPFGIVSDANYLYVSELFDGKISKIDLATGTIKTLLLDNLFQPNHLKIINNKLYFSELNVGRISYIDLTLDTPTVKTVTTKVNAPYDFVIHQNFMYVAESKGNIISKINLNTIDDDPQPKTFAVLESPYGLTKSDTHLYVSCRSPLYDNLISIDFETGAGAIVPSDEVYRNVADMFIKDNYIYCSFFDFNNGKITKLNLSTGKSTDLITELKAPATMELINDDLYVAEYHNRKILKYTFGTLSNPSFTAKNINFFIKNNILRIDSESIQQSSIYDTTGKEVLQFTGNQTSVDHIISGNYILKSTTKDNKIFVQKFAF